MFSAYWEPEQKMCKYANKKQPLLSLGQIKTANTALLVLAFKQFYNYKLGLSNLKYGRTGYTKT